ncbi:MAG: isoprenyl transferase [Kiritimatiellae bacterium]|nr:isoprenyl transferase [Kiritimatiellia bacterium]
MTKKTPTIPKHVAIIMDGNGRWARQQGLSRLKGHAAGAESVQAVLRASKEVGIQYLTLYAFSAENWVRPKDEIAGLMKLLQTYLSGHEHQLHENKICLRVIGRQEKLPQPVLKKLAQVEAATSNYKEGTLILALNYGGRAEIVDAVRKITNQVKQGKLSPNETDEKTVSNNLYAPDIPDPDLIIRTSGEMRISNFLLWQSSYAELYVTDVLWPEFREQHFKQAIEAYANRHRRYGDIQ